MKKLLALLASIHPLSESFEQALREKAIVLSLPRHHMLLEAARVSDCAYFLESGFAIAYTFIKGRKHIEKFYPAGRVVVSVRSFFEQLPSRETLELLETGEVVHITYDHLMSLMERFPEAVLLYRVIMNSCYEQSRDRIHDLQLLTAMERYEKLNEDYPAIGQLVPLEQIATYLGIAPQHLSRIRKI